LTKRKKQKKTIEFDNKVSIKNFGHVLLILATSRHIVGLAPKYCFSYEWMIRGAQKNGFSNEWEYGSSYERTIGLAQKYGF
jgi:hypothetical protein